MKFGIFGKIFVIISIWGSLIININYNGERKICVDFVRMIKIPRTGIVNKHNKNSLVLYSMHKGYN